MPGFMPGLGEEGLHQRHQDAHDLVGLVGRQDQRRQQADHGVGGDADHQPGIGGALQQRAAGAVELDADHQALAADLLHAGQAGRAALEGRRAAARRARGVLEQAVLDHDAQRLDAGAHGQRVAAEGGAVVAGAEARAPRAGR
jgi:hypothetical protein